MAGIAGNDRVRTVEDKIRLHIVVEQPEIPVDRVMAQTALITIPIVMWVVRGVAGIAF